MALQEFQMASLATMDDGRLSAAVEQELQRAVKDCLDRPNEKKPRKVTLVVEVCPGFVDETGDCEEAVLSFALRNSLPARRTRSYSMLAKKNGRLLWNDMSPDNVRQRTLDESSEQKEVNDE